MNQKVLEPFKQRQIANTAEEVADYIWQNVQTLQQESTPIPGATQREMMPQTDDAGGPSGGWTKAAPNPEKIPGVAAGAEQTGQQGQNPRQNKQSTQQKQEMNESLRALHEIFGVPMRETASRAAKQQDAYRTPSLTEVFRAINEAVMPQKKQGK